MPKYELNFLHFCDNAFLSADGKLNVIGIFDIVILQSVPGVLPKATIAGNLSINDVATDEIAVKITVKPKSGPIVIQPEITQKMPSKDKNGEQKIGFIIDLLNLEFKKTGIHILSIEVNKNIVKELTFNVAVAEEQ